MMIDLHFRVDYPLKVGGGDLPTNAIINTVISLILVHYYILKVKINSRAQTITSKCYLSSDIVSLDVMPY